MILIGPGGWMGRSAVLRSPPLTARKEATRKQNQWRCRWIWASSRGCVVAAPSLLIFSEKPRLCCQGNLGQIASNDWAKGAILFHWLLFLLVWQHVAAICKHDEISTVTCGTCYNLQTFMRTNIENVVNCLPLKLKGNKRWRQSWENTEYALWEWALGAVR